MPRSNADAPRVGKTEGSTPLEERPEIVCICGSARFATEMREANRELTFAGIIVLAPGEANGPVTHPEDRPAKRDAGHERRGERLR